MATGLRARPGRLARGSSRTTKAPVQVQVFVQFDDIMVGMRSGDDEDIKWRQERKFAPVFFIESTSANYVLEALIRGLPIPIKEKERLLKIIADREIVLLVLVHDSASSNLAAVNWFYDKLYHDYGTAVAFICHAERCFTHQVGIIISISISISIRISTSSSISIRIGNSTSTSTTLALALALALASACLALSLALRSTSSSRAPSIAKGGLRRSTVFRD